MALVESLEQTKTTAAEVQARDEEARATEAKIDEARGVYRDVAERTALVYFVVQDMVTLSPMYLFSLKVRQPDNTNLFVLFGEVLTAFERFMLRPLVKFCSMRILRIASLHLR